MNAMDQLSVHVTPKKEGDFQSPRIAFVWVTVSQIICTIPHANILPFWVILVCIGCLVWRFLVHQGRLSFPHRYFRYLLIIASIFGLMLYYPRVVSVQAAVTLLILTYYLKLLELFRVKDVYVILILSYFVIATVFLFNSEIYMFFYFVATFFTNLRGSNVME